MNWIDLTANTQAWRYISDTQIIHVAWFPWSDQFPEQLFQIYTNIWYHVPYEFQIIVFFLSHPFPCLTYVSFRLFWVNICIEYLSNNTQMWTRQPTSLKELYKEVEHTKRLNYSLSHSTLCIWPRLSLCSPKF